MLALQDESEFIAQLKGGNERAFLELVERHHAGLMRMAMVFVSNPSIAEEIVQETWLGVINGIQSFKAEASIKTWIFAILSNQAKKHARTAHRSVNLSALGELTLEDLYDADQDRFTARGSWLRPPRRWSIDPEQALLEGRLLEVLSHAIEALPEKQRVVFTMRDIQGFEAQDVLGVLAISSANQRVLLHRARAALRDALERHVQAGELAV